MYEGRDHPTSKCVQCVYYPQVSLGILEGEQWATFVELPKVAYFQCCILPFCLFDYPHHHWELLVFICACGYGCGCLGVLYSTKENQLKLMNRVFLKKCRISHRWRLLMQIWCT
jgi:hypothetical protein